LILRGAGTPGVVLCRAGTLRQRLHGGHQRDVDRIFDRLEPAIGPESQQDGLAQINGIGTQAASIGPACQQAAIGLRPLLHGRRIHGLAGLCQRGLAWYQAVQA